MARSARTTPTPLLHHRPGGELLTQEQSTAATLCYAGHLLMENRSALIVEAELAIADGYAERASAVEMLSGYPSPWLAQRLHLR